VYFTPSNGDIRYGLAAIRNVGEGAVQQIIRARTEQGPIESFTHFCRKVDAGVLHKKVLESLILAGAFDSFGYTRRGLLEGYQKVVEPILADRRAEEATSLLPWTSTKRFLAETSLRSPISCVRRRTCSVST
jgi:DNA polymerase III subunit alpha